MRVRILSDKLNETRREDEEGSDHLLSKLLQKINKYKTVSCIPQGSLAVRMQRIIDSGGIFCSFEFTPPSQAERLLPLLSCIKQLRGECNPLFNAITCHWNYEQRDCPPGLNLAQQFKSTPTTLLHLTGKGLTELQAHGILNWAQSCGVKNIFALQGDTSQPGISTPVFPHAVDLVRFIRECYGDYFTICVAGYPDRHPESLSQEQDIFHLKEKVNAGADFIITQVIFESKTFVQFVKLCRKAGIEVPIIPGVFAVPDYSSLLKMAKICKLVVPETMLRDLERIKGSDQTVVNYCIFKAVEMVKYLLSEKIASGIHFFTLNRAFAAREICTQVGLCQPAPGQMDIFWKENYKEFEFKCQ